MQKELWKKAHDRMEEIYGEQPPIQMISRFESEKAGLQDTDFIVFADFIGELASMCNREYGDIFNLGELESSFAAWLLGATKCNPLPAHYYCPRVCLKNSLIRNFVDFPLRHTLSAAKWSLFQPWAAVGTCRRKNANAVKIWFRMVSTLPTGR